MQKYQSVVQYNTGVAVAGASVTVKNYPSGTTATIYSDDGVTPTANPLTTDSTGRFSFYAADGHYSLEITGVSLAPYTVSDILLEDPTEPSDIWVQHLIMPGSDEHSIYSGNLGNYGWNDNVKELYATGPNAPSLANSFGPFYHYEFSADTMNEVFANFHIIHDQALATAIYPHFHIMTNSTATGVVRIGFEYSWARRSDDTGAVAFSTPVTVYKNFTIPSNTNGYHHVVQVDDANVIPNTTNYNIDTLFIMRFFRDAANPADTFPDTIFGLTVDLHYQTARFNTPNRDPNFFN